MAIYSPDVLSRLIIASIPALVSFHYFIVLKKERTAIFLLLLSAFVLRLLLISLDPYLQDWDERFHALVAKNMTIQPFTPMLRTHPIMEYDRGAWCCNHIWVHKQPLFLWQMAISMKLLGVNILSLRLPSVLLGTASVFFTYEIAKYWTRNLNVAFFSALLLTFSFYQLELTSGRFSLEHNDVAFMSYVTASIWSFLKLIQNDYSLKWAVLIGLFVGCAILTKWLTGLLIFGGWGLYLLLNTHQVDNANQKLNVRNSCFHEDPISTT